MNFRNLFTLVIILNSLPAASSMAAGSVSLPLEGLIQTALEKNRDLQIAALEIKRAKSRARWSGRLSNPQLQISTSNDFAGLNEGESSQNLAFVQKFPVTSRLKQEKNVRRVELLLAEAELAENRRALAYQIHGLAVKLLAAKNTRAAQSRLIGLNKKITDFLHGRAQVGEASKLDVTQMRLNGRSLIRQASSLDAQMTKLYLALKQHLNIPTHQTLNVIGTLTLPDSLPSEKIGLATVLENRPDYLSALIKADVARAELLLQKAKRWQDVGINLFAQSNDEMDEPIGLERNTMLGIGFSIPLPLFNRNRQGVEVAAINIDAAKQESEKQKFVINNELSSALQFRSAAWKLANIAAEKDVQLANQNYQDFKAAYENGQVSIIQVQRSQEQLIQLETVALQLQRSYHLADAAVRFTRGDYPSLKAPSSNSSN
ncbi:MAG: TolC family protein [Verrucomicrobiales bacterium]|nr:TolC family protein [Verrucomicrobiales bacterium]